MCVFISLEAIAGRPRPPARSATPAREAACWRRRASRLLDHPAGLVGWLFQDPQRPSDVEGGEAQRHLVVLECSEGLAEGRRAAVPTARVDRRGSAGYLSAPTRAWIEPGSCKDPLPAADGQFTSCRLWRSVRCTVLFLTRYASIWPLRSQGLFVRSQSTKECLCDPNLSPPPSL